MYQILIEIIIVSYNLNFVTNVSCDITTVFKENTCIQIYYYIPYPVISMVWMK